MMTKQKIKYAVADCLTALGSLESVKVPGIDWDLQVKAITSLETILKRIESDERTN